MVTQAIVPQAILILIKSNIENSTIYCCVEEPKKGQDEANMRGAEHSQASVIL